MGLYAPNGSKDIFFKDLGEKIGEHEYGLVILMGDFNRVIDPLKEKKKIKNNPRNVRGKLPKTMFKIMEEENLIDCWSVFNSSLREYTFFSNRHKTYSRIDMILIPKQLLTFTKKPEILPQTLSDHNSVMWVGKDMKVKYQWRLNEKLLSQKENIQKLKEEIIIFF